ncbi:MAG: hypothetical protein WEB89_05470 [Balneolales bacterium]
MNSHSDKTDRKREDLERKINDAADGLLSVPEIGRLEEELMFFPDLHQDYLDIMELPDLSAIYEQGRGRFQNDFHVVRTRQRVRKEWSQTGSFEAVTVAWFRKYALAASFLIFALTSITHYFSPQHNIGQDEMILTDILYPYEESSTEAYVIYLDELIDQ